VQRSRHQIRAALQHLKTVLADAGVRSAERRVDPIEEALRRFDEHMLRAKGLAESTRLRRLTVVRSLACQTVAVLPTADELRHFIGQEFSSLEFHAQGSANTTRCAGRRFPLRARSVFAISR
jgi:hypothetical protein